MTPSTGSTIQGIGLQEVRFASRISETWLPIVRRCRSFARGRAWARTGPLARELGRRAFVALRRAPTRAARRRRCSTLPASRCPEKRATRTRASGRQAGCAFRVLRQDASNGAFFGLHLFCGFSRPQHKRSRSGNIRRSRRRYLQFQGSNRIEPLSCDTPPRAGADIAPKSAPSVLLRVKGPHPDFLAETWDASISSCEAAFNQDLTLDESCRGLHT